jgi:hypothetical protein
MDGKTLKFHLTGLVGANFVMKDSQTGTTWQQATGAAVAGPLQGQRLPLIPFLLTTWSEWREQHPKTLVLAPVIGYRPRYNRMREVVAQASFGMPGDEHRALKHDKRLPDREMIVGIELPRRRKAYPLKMLREQKVVNDVAGREPVLLVYQPGSQTTTAFLRRAGNRVLEFRAAGSGVKELIDEQTHSRWTAYGRCIAGRLKGQRLKELIPMPSFWYAWAEFYPKTEVYGGGR